MAATDTSLSSRSLEPPATVHGERGARPWRSRLFEFLLVGGLTPFLFPLSWVLRARFGLDAAELAVGFTMFHAAHLINDPHFAVTYALFYDDGRARAFGRAFAPAQRARYLFAGFVAPLVLAAWAAFALATRSAPALGLMIELMFLLVGWHYVKQGFGVLVVLAARDGVRFTSGERLAILAHAYAGWAYAWASPATVSREVEEKGVVYTALPHPAALDRVTHVVFLATALPLAWVLVRKWRREGGHGGSTGRLPLLAPLVAFLASVWAWSIYSGVDPLVRYVIPALHSVQYLFMVGLLATNEAREREGPPWFERSLRVRVGTLVTFALGLGWLLFHAAPWLLDGAFVSKRSAQTALGATPFFAAIYAFVNIHHYLMDSVIWRRDNPKTRYLMHVR